MSVPYDATNIFACVLRGEIPVKRLYEDEYALAFPDINPQAPVHVQIIPKGAYVDFSDFAARATGAEITGFIRAIGVVAAQLGVEADGYRLISNCGANAYQDVPHLHIHLFAGGKLGPKLVKGDNVFF